MSSGRRLGMFAAAAVLLASCTQILGLDYEYRSSTGTASTATTSNTGGAGVGGGQTGSTTSGTTGNGGKPGCGTFVYDPLAPCQSCMEKRCCVELGGCDEGTACAELVGCVRNCGDDNEQCREDCLKDDQNQHAGIGVDAHYALFECNYLKCRTDDACIFPICDSSFTTYDRSCSACAGTEAGCCSAVKACDTSSACLACLGDPEAPGCSTNAKYQAVFTCQTQTCGAECAYTICGSPDFGYYESSCNDCLSGPSGCCMPFNECTVDESSTCYRCMTGTEVAACDSDPRWNAFQACLDGQCGVPCSGISDI